MMALRAYYMWTNLYNTQNMCCVYVRYYKLYAVFILYIIYVRLYKKHICNTSFSVLFYEG